MIIFHSYVSLPEGKDHVGKSPCEDGSKWRRSIGNLSTSGGWRSHWPNFFAALAGGFTEQLYFGWRQWTKNLIRRTPGMAFHTETWKPAWRSCFFSKNPSLIRLDIFLRNAQVFWLSVSEKTIDFLGKLGHDHTLQRCFDHPSPPSSQGHHGEFCRFDHAAGFGWPLGGWFWWRGPCWWEMNIHNSQLFRCGRGPGYRPMTQYVFSRMGDKPRNIREIKQV